MIVSNSGYVPGLNQTKQLNDNPMLAAASGNSLPEDGSSSVSVKISEAANSKVWEKTTGFTDIRTEDGMYRFGLVALGQSTIQEWSSKGMEFSDETVIAAGEALQQAMNEAFAGSSQAGTSVALNKHQIIINSQDVPDWFRQEFQNSLAALDNEEMKNAFKKGELAFISKPSFSNSDALANYESIAKSI